MAECEHKNLVLITRPLYDQQSKKLGEVDMIMCPVCGEIAANKLKTTKSNPTLKRAPLPQANPKPSQLKTQAGQIKPGGQPANLAKSPSITQPQKSYGADNTPRSTAAAGTQNQSPTAQNPSQVSPRNLSQQAQSGSPLKTETKKIKK